MNHFNDARMNGATDSKFQRVYNQLLNILNEEIRKINVTITNGLIISSDGTTISILTASATQSGALSSTDWTTFNNKQNHSNELDGITNLADTAGFVKKTGDGAYAIDTNSYLNLDQTIPDTTVGTLAFPDFKITDQQLGTPTYSTLGDYFNTVQSSGRISGMVITAHTSPSVDGSVDVGVGTGIIKTTNALGADTKFFDYAGGNVALTDLSLNYIYLYYDTGTASVKLGATTNRSTIHTYDQFTIGRAYRQGTTVDIVSSGVNIYNEYRRIHDRLVKRYGFAWASGSTLSESDTRKLAVSDGVWYIGNTEIDTTGFNTNVSGTFNLEYTSNSGSTWTINSSATQLGNTQYNNIASGLTSLGVSKYANYWVYICPEGDLYVVYGQVQYNSLAEAQVATSPSVLRNYISANTRLIARITFKQGATNFASVSNALVSAISATASTTHNNLGGLQGGTTDEYYHMTSAQNTNLGTVTSAGWALIDDASASAQLTTLGAIPADGWISANETWTYASASTFTVSGNVTSKYQRGDKIKWSQTTVRYGYILSLVYSSPNTTITIVVNTDYVIDNAVISANYFSRIENPLYFPQWFNYTPTYTGFSSPPSGGYHQFCIKGRTCFIDISPDSNGTSNAANFIISVPVPIYTGRKARFPITSVDNGVVTDVSSRSYLDDASSGVVCYKSWVSDVWTTSGGKRALFSLFYPI